MKNWTVVVTIQLLKCIDAFTLFHVQDSVKRGGRRNIGIPTFASREGLVKITDVEAELIARKIKEENLINIPMIPGFMQIAVVEQSLKAILEVGPVVLPRDVFNKLVAGKGGAVALNEALIRDINDRIDIPILSTSAQNDLVEKMCEILFSPTTFKTVKRQMLSRAARDLIYEDSRQSLATKLNDMVDIPFVSNEKEQKAADAIVNKCYSVLEKVISPDLMSKLETSTPEELRDVKENLIARLNKKINFPFTSEEQEEEVIRFIVDFWLNYYGLSIGTKTTFQQLIQTEKKLRALDIELEALKEITQQHINSISHDREAMKVRLEQMVRTFRPPSTDVGNVVILKDADAVGQRIRDIVVEEAERAIADRGHFALAIPGGSILKMLTGSDLKNKSWMAKTTIFYVNHKCVPMNDINLATHAKAEKLFLSEWEGVNVIKLGGSADAEMEAANYEEQMKSLDENVLPIDPETDLPVFDLSLIGVGDDGHIGSLYPDRDEVLSGTYGPWVLPVAMKEPPSITLSLPVMKGGKNTVVAACGVSDKYPQGKADGMRRAIAADDETIVSFPAVGLRDCALWVIDEMAASKLGGQYLED